MVANDMITGEFVFGWPPDELGVLTAMVVLCGEPTELTWPGVSQMRLFNQLCACRALPPAPDVLCPEAMVWLRPEAWGEATPGSREADIITALKGCITMTPDLRLTAAAAGALFEHALSSAGPAPDAQPGTPPATLALASPPDAQRQSALPQGVSGPPLKPPLKQPTPWQSPRRLLCCCTGDGCAWPCAKRCDIDGWCTQVAESGRYCSGCKNARAEIAANTDAAGAVDGKLSGGADRVPGQAPKPPITTGSHPKNNQPAYA